MVKKSAQMKQARAEAREHERRVKHHHGICQDCAGGLVDVGVLALRGERASEDREAFVCCICLAQLRGPNIRAFRCRVLDPDPPESPV